MLIYVDIYFCNTYYFISWICIFLIPWFKILKILIINIVYSFWEEFGLHNWWKQANYGK
jgi:hypothetical protein